MRSLEEDQALQRRISRLLKMTALGNKSKTMNVHKRKNYPLLCRMAMMILMIALLIAVKETSTKKIKKLSFLIINRAVSLGIL